MQLFPKSLTLYFRHLLYRVRKINPDKFELEIVRKCVNIIHILNIYNLKTNIISLKHEKIESFCCMMLLQLMIIPTESGRQSAGTGSYRRLLEAKNDPGFWGCRQSHFLDYHCYRTQSSNLKFSASLRTSLKNLTSQFFFFTSFIQAVSIRNKVPDGPCCTVILIIIRDHCKVW